MFREFDGGVFGNLEIHREYIHRGADGRRMLVLHGDEFDSVVKCSSWLAKLGSNLCDVLLAANPYVNRVRRKFDLPRWSLSSYLKNKAKTAVQYIGSFEDAVAQAARKRGVDTVVCGHIHRAEMRASNGILYCNDGDWVESCTSFFKDPELAAEQAERRWFAVRRVVKNLKAECDVLYEVLQLAEQEWRSSSAQLAQLEALRDALADQMAAVEEPCATSRGAPVPCEVMSAA